MDDGDEAASAFERFEYYLIASLVVLNDYLLFLAFVLQIMEWFVMLRFIRYQDRHRLGTLTYEALNQPNDLELREKTFRGQELILKKRYSIILVVYTCLTVVLQLS